MLAALESVVCAGQAEGRTVDLCGELAAHPAAVVLALGMGIDSLSMAPSAVPRAKWVLRSVTARTARALGRAEDSRRMVDAELERAGVGSLIARG